MRPQGRILAFHQTSGSLYPGINNVNHRDFGYIFELIHSWGYTFHGFSTFDRKLDDFSVVISFDDGYEDNLPVIEDLIDRSAAPAVFIPTGHIGKKNDWEYSSRLFAARHLDREQIRHLADNGVIIGSHGVSHRSFTAMSNEMLRRELAESKVELENITGRPVDLISFPFGRTDERVNDAARECGYRIGFTLGETMRAAPDESRFVVSRIPVYSADDYYSLRGKLGDESLRERLKDRIINMLAAGTIIVRGRLK